MKQTTPIYAFLKNLSRFEYRLSVLDHVWDIYFPDRQKCWSHLQVVKYRETFYLAHIDGETPGLEVVPEKSVTLLSDFGRPVYVDEETATEQWSILLKNAEVWLKKVEKDWIRANKQVEDDYPLARRYGIVPHSLVRASLNEFWRFDEELGKRRCRKFIRLVEDGAFFHDRRFKVETLTAADYFEYCRIAYIAAKRKKDNVDESMTGRAMYERHADGRHEGLLDIDENSAQEFADWIDGTHPKRIGGGHPWEIKRGGNTTHINLSVRRPPYGAKEGYIVELCGESFTRLAETVKMALALIDAGKPITIADPEGIRTRLLGQDNIGIVPEQNSLHRANQRFPKHQNVYDVLDYRSLGRYKRRLNPFITWEPLPILRPRS